MLSIEFCRLMGVKNLKKAYVVAIQREIPGGESIIEDEREAFIRFKMDRSPDNRQWLNQCRQRRADANAAIKAKYQLEHRPLAEL